MSNSYTKIYIHYVFSTKHRSPLIRSEFENRLWQYLGGIAKKHHMIPLAIGGVADHIHALLILPPTISVAKAVQLLKGGASKWINDHFTHDRSFRWQTGYGAFSVSESNLHAVIKYINRQKEHHKKTSFQEEYLMFLEKHNVTYRREFVFKE